ncbi:MAG: hypothetical protein NC078_11610, partial [Ruminococcus sp.]|nr:hypothetical protein [Ruminococcus sp.]
KENWSISVQYAEVKDGETVYVEKGTISDVRNRSAVEIAGDFEKIITDMDYTKEDAFLCDLMYNSNDSGSRIAKNNTDDMLKYFQQDLGYKNLFASTTDLYGMGD